MPLGITSKPSIGICLTEEEKSFLPDKTSDKPLSLGILNSLWV